MSDEDKRMTLESVVTCRDGCGKSAPVEEVMKNGGWVWLPILGRWRCKDCELALESVNAKTSFSAGKATRN